MSDKRLVASIYRFYLEIYVSITISKTNNYYKENYQ